MITSKDSLQIREEAEEIKEGTMQNKVETKALLAKMMYKINTFRINRASLTHLEANKKRLSTMLVNKRYNLWKRIA
jgi:hypothetical protein